jgi:hypothetical protein
MDVKKIISIIGSIGTVAVAAGAGAGMNASGCDTWEIVSAVIGIVAGGGVGITASTKFAQLRDLVKVLAETSIAFGLAAIAATTALEPNSPGGVNLTTEERADIAAKSKAVIAKKADIFNATLKLIGKVK